MLNMKEAKNRADKYSMEDDIPCFICGEQVLVSGAWCIYVHDNLQVNLGDDYRGHLVAAHGVKHNFNYYMQQVRMRLLNILSEISRLQGF